MTISPVLIVGGGMAGISCARYLHEASIPFLLCESQERLGGRIQSDTKEGFILDRGFQVLLTSYPEIRKLLDYRNFPVRPFFPGAVIWTGEGFHRIADPFRRPMAALSGLFAPVGSLRDKYLVLQLRFEAMRGSLSRIWELPEVSSLQYLSEFGFSDRFIRSFFKPFLGGVFLDRALATSSRMMLFVIRMFGAGMAVLPARGMGALPQQIAAPLPKQCIRVDARVNQVRQDHIVLESGEALKGSAVVIAADGVTAEIWGAPRRAWRGTTCVYFAASQPPWRSPDLLLNGSGTGQITSVVVLSNIAPEYAPIGKSLISVSIPECTSDPDTVLEARVRGELGAWFGAPVDTWQFLRAYRIPEALPEQLSVPLGGGVLDTHGAMVCGDYCAQGSINGALASGRVAAERIIERLSRSDRNGPGVPLASSGSREGV